MPVSGTNAVIDLYHGSRVESFAAVKAAGILGVIHKATAGTDFQDPEYLNRKPAAAGHGLLWGCYHYASGEDPIAQANFFLKIANPGPKDLVALDCEPTYRPKGARQPPNMTYTQLVAFVRQIQAKLGRPPVIYGGNSLLNELMTGHAGSIVNACPLWFAEYPSNAKAKSPSAPLPEGWKSWTLWQYTGDGIGPAPTSVAGITGSCDRDTYNGPADDLVAKWPLT